MADELKKPRKKREKHQYLLQKAFTIAPGAPAGWEDYPNPFQNTADAEKFARGADGLPQVKHRIVIVTSTFTPTVEDRKPVIRLVRSEEPAAEPA